MLEKVDLSKRVEKNSYKKIISPLELRIGELQREAKEKGLPVIILFEGWDAAGKGTLINRLIMPLDPRGFTVHTMLAPSEEERLKPFLWRFWTRIPLKGRIAIYDRSWYRRISTDRVDKNVEKNDWQSAFSDITAFERQLSDGGYAIIKFFLHISKKDQKKRLRRLDDDKATTWRVKGKDWKNHKKYAKYLAAYDEMIEKTDSGFSPWTVVEAHDRRFATVKIFKTVIASLENALKGKPVSGAVKRTEAKPAVRLKNMDSSVLDKIDLSKSITEKEYSQKMKEYREELRAIEHKIYKKRIPIIILYEGWDAAGKGGNIRRITQNMDPRGYGVIPVAAPNDVEKAHHYLWRFWNAIPKGGHIAIFDRTWYGRVLVERVEKFCSETDWKRAYHEINEMEEHLSNFGAVIFKFWLEISKEEQMRRFNERKKMAHKRWKITDEDWRNRKKWEDYKEAVDEMLFRTSTTYAPWTIVESNCKLFARIKTMKTIADKMSKIL